MKVTNNDLQKGSLDEFEAILQRVWHGQIPLVNSRKVLSLQNSGNFLD